jgi:hypothetical protein
VLNFKLEVLEHRFSDNFPAVHRRLHLQQLLDHELSTAEMAVLGKVASFPFAPDGNSAEVQQFWKY